MIRPRHKAFTAFADAGLRMYQFIMEHRPSLVRITNYQNEPPESAYVLCVFRDAHDGANTGGMN